MQSNRFITNVFEVLADYERGAKSDVDVLSSLFRLIRAHGEYPEGVNAMFSENLFDVLDSLPTMFTNIGAGALPFLAEGLITSESSHSNEPNTNQRKRIAALESALLGMTLVEENYLDTFATLVRPSIPVSPAH